MPLADTLPQTTKPLRPIGGNTDSFQLARELERELRSHLRGEVCFDNGSRALYATDASNYRQVPIGIVMPRDASDVKATILACKAVGAPILARGAGTSLAGQCCNVAVVLDFSKYMNRILEFNPDAHMARVEPGVVLDALRSQAERYHLTFGPDPSTHSRCTLGGMIGNNSCGTHSLLAGKTVDNVHELRIVLYDGTELLVGATSEAEVESAICQGGRRGQIYSGLQSIRDRYAPLIRQKFPKIPRRVSGYNLDQLLPENGFHVARALVGSEGTCVTVLEANLRLIHSPRYRKLVCLGFPDVFAAADHVPAILGFDPIGLEGFEGSIVDGLRRKGSPNLHLLPEGRGFVLVEFGSDDPDDSIERATQLVRRLTKSGAGAQVRIYSESEATAVWKIRESGPRAAAMVPGAPPRWEGWDDASVAPERLGPYLRDLRRLLDEFGYEAAFYGHFGHGCIHMQVSFDLSTEEGITRYGEFVERGADLVVSYGGSLSGEHGDGQSRGALLPKMFGDELMRAFGEFKAIWDPDNKQNPHKLINAYLPTDNLRLGLDHKLAQPATFFRFPDDNGSLANASLRCIGLGECRKESGGTMCPSYMVTLDEEHSTRGRAHMLFEMLRGEVLRDGWQNEDIKHALDSCLSCKACKAECPTNVDIATYKAEFLAHYYESKRRPLHAYAFGRIDKWASLGSLVPGLTSLALRAPGVRGALGYFLNLAPQRDIPRLAATPFVKWAQSHHISTTGDSSKTSRSKVILWVDTFNNYFRPDTSRAALEVLRLAGFHVLIPSMRLCCGRPLYDFGMLDVAKEYLSRITDQLAAEIDAGTPIVVLEPSCASVFRDELRNILPTDSRATRLRQQTFLLSEFLARHAPNFRPPSLAREVLLHGHCHQKALMKMTDSETILRRMGANVTSPDLGCCGMAGPFGFSANTYEMSRAVGERMLLPAVRRLSMEALIISDGFSCREQIQQMTGRTALHLAEAIQLAAADAC